MIEILFDIKLITVNNDILICIFIKTIYEKYIFKKTVQVLCSYLLQNRVQHAVI